MTTEGEGPLPQSYASSDYSEWPDWSLEAGSDLIKRLRLRELTRYVDHVTAEVTLPTDLHDDTTGGGQVGTSFARQIYAALRKRDIRYAPMAWGILGHDTDWNAFVKQRIRPPHSVLSGTATCLDIALVYAAQCMAVGLRTFVAVKFDKPRHVMVLLDVQRRINDGVDNGEQPPQFNNGYEGIWGDPADRRAPRHAGHYLDEWLAVDIVQATRDRGREPASFATAIKAGDQHFAKGDWWLVDVAAAQTLQASLGSFTLHKPPRPQFAARVTQLLPGRPEFTEYPSRAALVGRTETQISQAKAPEARGLHLVIKGDRGVGKSMLAHRLATQVDGAYGWWLDASSTEALIRSLAEIERRERALSGSVDDLRERAGLAQAAVHRLRTSPAPWVVVLDNFDRDVSPDDIALFASATRAGQVVLVTTSNLRWLGPSSVSESWREESVLALTSDDLSYLQLPADIIDSAGGLPLVLQPLRALLESGFNLDGTTTGADRVWEVFHRGPRLANAVHRVDVDAARLVAWAPRGPIPTYGMPVRSSSGIVDPELSVVATRRLVDLQLLTEFGGVAAGGLDRERQAVVEMHGLLAEAVRRAPDAREDVVLDVVTRILTDEGWGRSTLIYSPDSSALRVLNDYVDELSEQGIQAAGLLWHGLGSVRERRGPVRASKAAFQAALSSLSPDEHPWEVAEGRIGLIRIEYQANEEASEQEWKTWQEELRKAGHLLTEAGPHPTEDDRYRPMPEQANALFWLIGRDKIASRMPQGNERLGAYVEILEELIKSYHLRLQLAGQLVPADVSEVVVQPAMGSPMTVDRAYYNLAGTYLRVAQEYAWRLGNSSERDDTDSLDQIRTELIHSEEVYQRVRQLREYSFGGSEHPHLAACINGLATVQFYRAALLGEWERLVTAISFIEQTMLNRYTIAAVVGTVGPRAAFNDGDFRKTLDLAVKTLMAMRLVGEYSKRERRVILNHVIADVSTSMDVATLALLEKGIEARGEAFMALARGRDGKPSQPAPAGG